VLKNNNSNKNKNKQQQNNKTTKQNGNGSLPTWFGVILCILAINRVLLTLAGSTRILLPSKARLKRIIIGKRLLKMVVRKVLVDGVKINMDYHGKLYQLNILN
jgi:hypothetical protein